MLAPNGLNMSISSRTRQECFRIDWRDAVAATGRTQLLSPNGKESINESNRHGDFSIRQEYWVGEERSSITTPKKWPDANGAGKAYPAQLALKD